VAALSITLVLYRFSALKAGILAGYELAFAWGLSWWAFRAGNLIIDPLYPSLVILLVYASALALALVQGGHRSGHRLRRA
jgi:CHASE2 domain-containing sensor protein